MGKKVLIIIVILALAAGGVILYMNSKDSDDNGKTASTSSESHEHEHTEPASDTSTHSDATPAATITYSDSGFGETVTVKSGDTVAIKNTSSNNLQFDSDPHPDHTDNTELNVGLVKPGETKTFVVTKKGTFGLHNHLNASDKGTIIVQ